MILPLYWEKRICLSYYFENFIREFNGKTVKIDTIIEYIISLIKQSDSFIIAELIAKKTGLKVCLMPQPNYINPGKSFDNNSLSAMKLFSECFQNSLKEICDNFGISYCMQVPESTCSYIYTDSKFMIKELKEDGSRDLRHMNQDFGKLQILQLEMMS